MPPVILIDSIKMHPTNISRTLCPVDALTARYALVARVPAVSLAEHFYQASGGLSTAEILFGFRVEQANIVANE